MEFLLESGPPEKQRVGCVAAAVFQPRRLSGAAKLLDDASSGYLSAILKRGDMEGEKNQTLLLHNVPNTSCERVLLIGLGEEKSFDPAAFRKAHADLARTLKQTGATSAVSYLTELAADDLDIDQRVRQAVLLIEDQRYSFERMKTERQPQRSKLRKLALFVADRADHTRARQALREGQAIAGGIALAKDLGNLPGNVCTPVYLADQARALKKGQRKLKVSVLTETEMEKLGMGALLSVARGSDQPPRLITLEYKGADKKTKPVVLVGKGITFDTGGISIKPGQAMDEMKFDMCGAASVFGAVKATAELDLPINLVGIVASAENMPDGRATKPGDIVTTMSGQTVEILNTDAEGRLVLCDALTYAERFDPAAVIDIATLTGACIVALGNHASGLMTNHEPLGEALLEAGRSSGDRAWQLPLWDEYQELLKSNFADMANIGDRSAGTITAACYLSRFTRKYHWAHLDIAGTAWHSGAKKGATGRPVPLLTQYLIDRANGADRG
ncbi:MAG: leucyl aminopeptidase [Gammaproteobacteria bacterium]